MLPTESPFPCCWKDIDLENVNARSRATLSLYGQYPYHQLPPLPIELRGDFGWLAQAPTHRLAIGANYGDQISDSLKRLCASAAHHGLQLPKEFITFFETPTLSHRIREGSCFLELSSKLVRSPRGSGYLALFLMDYQGCGFWYLYLDDSGKDHAIVCSSNCYDEDLQEYYGPPSEPSYICYVAESFEMFLCRCWLESELWFAGYEKKPISDLGQQYLSHHQSSANKDSGRRKTNHR